MPRRELLTAAQREALLAFPDEEENLLQHYVLSVRDLAAARQLAATTIGWALRYNFATCVIQAGFWQRMKRRHQQCLV
jgi:hypothetical protein